MRSLSQDDRGAPRSCQAVSLKTGGKPCAAARKKPFTRQRIQTRSENEHRLVVAGGRAILLKRGGSSQNMKQTRRLAWFIVSTVALCAILGGAYGQRVEATTSPADDSDVQTGLGAFTKVFDAVEQNYADPVDPDRAIYGPPQSNLGAIPGMLRTLDPHSNFFAPRAFQQLREEQEGKYYGVGMQIS